MSNAANHGTPPSDGGSNGNGNGNGTRKPRVFRLDDPSLQDVAPAPEEAFDNGPEPASRAAPPPVTLPPLDLERGFRWGALLFSALTAAAMFALSLWFYRLVSVGLWRDDWIGWTMWAILGVGGLALVMLVLREIIGLSRLGRLNRLKADVTTAIAARDVKAELAATKSVHALYVGRPELKWHGQRLKEHMRDVHDPGALLALADRDLLAEVDGAVRREITTSARRVATVTALSPMMLIAVGFVLVENMRLLRRIAALYGGRPGAAGLFKLARRVFGHLIATGGVAMTDDLLGQFIGQDLMRRLSARLGEGAFNGALTARIGVAAIDLIRPLPFIEARPVRVRDVLAEALKTQWGKGDPPPDAKANS
jgi:putative membrane protein